jgi:hypothetical protein
LILNGAQIHVAETLGQKRFRERADHDERAELNGRDENRSLGLTSPRTMNEQISEQSGWLSLKKPRQTANPHGSWHACRANSGVWIVSLFRFTFKPVRANLLAFFSEFKGVMHKLDGRATANMNVALENVCRVLPNSGRDRETREYIAKKLLQAAKKGERTLGALEAVG